MHTTIRHFLSHDAPPWMQFVKYGIAGGMATVVHIVTFFLLGWFLFPCLTQDDIMVRLLGLEAPIISETLRAWNAGVCNLIGFVFSNTFVYLMNRWFVFRPGRHSWPIEFLLFTGVSAISMTLGLTIQSVMIATWGLQTTLAFSANIASAVLINFVMRKFVVFKG